VHQPEVVPAVLAEAVFHEDGNVARQDAAKIDQSLEFDQIRGKGLDSVNLNLVRKYFCS
jgi:hypothetical protein